MALSTAERLRLEAAERALETIAISLRGAGSKNQLNRLLVLAQDQMRKLTIRVEAIETTATELLALLRRLQ